MNRSQNLSQRDKSVKLGDPSLINLNHNVLTTIIDKLSTKDILPLIKCSKELYYHNIFSLDKLRKKLANKYAKTKKDIDTIYGNYYTYEKIDELLENRKSYSYLSDSSYYLMILHYVELLEKEWKCKSSNRFI